MTAQGDLPGARKTARAIGGYFRMGTSYEEMVAEAMKLPLRDRVKLAQQLASSLDGAGESDVEELWLAEAERRLHELRTGKASAIDAPDAFRRARRDLRK